MLASATLGLLSPHSGTQRHHLCWMSLYPHRRSLQLMFHGFCLDASQVATETVLRVLGCRPGIPSLSTVTLTSTLVTLNPSGHRTHQEVAWMAERHAHCRESPASHGEHC